MQTLLNICELLSPFYNDWTTVLITRQETSISSANNCNLDRRQGRTRLFAKQVPHNEIEGCCYNFLCQGMTFLFKIVSAKCIYKQQRILARNIKRIVVILVMSWNHKDSDDQLANFGSVLYIPMVHYLGSGKNHFQRTKYWYVYFRLQFMTPFGIFETANPCIFCPSLEFNFTKWRAYCTWSDIYKWSYAWVRWVYPLPPNTIKIQCGFHIWVGQSPPPPPSLKDQCGLGLQDWVRRFKPLPPWKCKGGLCF